MKLTTLISTMNLVDEIKLLNKMNIQTDSLIINQNDKIDYRSIINDGKLCEIYTFNEKGVGLSRNSGLMRINSDITIIADDDVRYFDNYAKKVEEIYKKYSDSDVIIFNLREKETNRYQIKKKFNVNRFNYMRFGAARFTFKTQSVTKNNIFFNIHFGGGTDISAGEDVLFLKECLDKKLKIIAVPVYIGELLTERESTWFEGYNEKFFKDKGKLYYRLNKKFSRFYSIRYALKYKNEYKEDMDPKNALKNMFLGISQEKKEHKEF